MNLRASEDKRQISSNNMQYKEGRPEVRRYDACYYVIRAREDFSCDNGACESHSAGNNTVNQPSIMFRVNKKQNMNVYIWEGTSKTESLRAINYYNAQAELESDYAVPINTGILLIVIPEKD